MGRNTLRVGNWGTDDLCLMIEPLGEDYWVKPAEVLTVGPEVEGIDVWFETAYSPGCVAVWLYEDGDPAKVQVGFVVVDAEGTALECGHQRPPGRQWTAAGPMPG